MNSKELIEKVMSMKLSKSDLRKVLEYDAYDEISFLATELNTSSDDIITNLKSIVKDKRSLIKMSCSDIYGKQKKCRYGNINKLGEC